MSDKLKTFPRQKRELGGKRKIFPYQRKQPFGFSSVFHSEQLKINK